jgi:hypothetical protein
MEEDNDMGVTDPLDITAARRRCGCDDMAGDERPD